MNIAGVSDGLAFDPMPTSAEDPLLLPVEVSLPLTAVLIFLNGFFVASEFALVKARRARIASLSDQGSHVARATSAILRRLDVYLAAAQLGITLASLALGWIGEPAVAAVLREPLADAGVDDRWLHPLSFAVGFGLITMLHITLGEQVPKMWAIARPEGMALGVTPGLRLFYIVALPAIRLLNGLSNGVLRLFGLRPVSEEDRGAHKHRNKKGQKNN